ncbi:MAG TPA: hypothetical protein VN873_17835 [Candidatus Angelobacter sp.]|nr:hypothetical protein [Candidatus Angelobacter sp.]
MDDPIEFTPKEKFQISLYKDVNGLFKRSVLRSLRYLIPSLALIAYYFYSGDMAAGILGYGILLFQAVYRLSILKRGLLTTASIHRKYEAQLQRKRDTA